MGQLAASGNSIEEDAEQKKRRRDIGELIDGHENVSSL